MTASAVTGPAAGVRRGSAVPARLQRVFPATLLGLVLLTCLALASASPPRRTGDAHQYLAMALQLQALRPPSLSPTDQAALTAWIEAQPPDSGFPGSEAALRQPALIRDGRQEFSHFWLYPLLTTPALTVAKLVGAHPVTAFLATNSLLFTAALVAVARSFGVAAALCLLATPILWFLPRAQVEVFMFAFITLAVCAAARGRWAAGALALAVAATQNLPVAAGITLFWVMGLLAHRARRRSQPLPHQRPEEQLPSTPPSVSRACRETSYTHGARRGLSTSSRHKNAAWSKQVGWRPAVAHVTRDRRWLLAVVVATCTLELLHPAYYVWRLGVVTPQQLNGGIAAAPPDLARYLAPLVGPDIGMAWWMPIPLVTAGVGGALIWRRPARCRPGDKHLLAVCAALFAWLLFAVAQTTNVNSGGTVHVSRYTLWLLPLLLPLTAPALRLVTAGAPRALPALLAAACLVYAHTFQPDQPERYVEFSPPSRWLMEHAPALYRPLPEIFVERALHTDGGPRLSAASADCRIMYLASSSPSACLLAPDEAAAIATRFADGNAALWLRHDGARFPGEPAISLVAP